MAIVDIKRKYKVSILSWFWLFLQPLLMIFMYWFAFSAGGQSLDTVTYNNVDYNYLQWLLIGVLSWSYCGDILLGGPQAIKQYLWMPKNFGIPPRISVIFVNISKFLIGATCMIIGFIISMIINGAEGRPIATLSALEVPVILVLMFVFMLAWSYCLAPIFAISKDMQNIMMIVPMVLSWISGVFIKPYGAIGDNETTTVVNIILQINPFNFLINGFRASTMGYGHIFVASIYNEWYSILSFFLFLLFFLVLGYVIEKKAKRFLLDII